MQVTAAPPSRLAFYARVSTEDQAERDTVRSQLDYLARKYAPDFQPDAPSPMEFAGQFVDEGYSGALALGDRPEGRRLLQAAASGAVDVVVVYRLDRLGRSARVLLDAHDELDRLGVAVISATEPFDTRTGIGRFLFQLLASIAELERSTIRERMTLGRDRVARTGRFINGAIPYGFDLDAQDHLVKSSRLVTALECTEAEVAALILERVADGQSAAAVARWLNAHGVPATSRYHRTGGTIKETRIGDWRRDRICDMVRTSTYRGLRVLKFAGGPVEQEVPSIVDEVTWRRANQSLDRGAQSPLQTSVYTYLLRGRLVCGLCGGAMQGNRQKKNGRLYYGCLRAPGRALVRGQTCHIGYVNGDALEELVLSELDEFFEDPDVALDALRDQLRERVGATTDHELQIRRLHARLRETEEGKRDIMQLVKRRKVTVDEASVDLDELAQEAATIRVDLENLANQRALTEALEVQLLDSATMLKTIGVQWRRWRETNDRPQLQAIVQQLVIEVRAFPGNESRRTYTVGPVQNDLTLSADGLISRQLQITRGVA